MNSLIQKIDDLKLSAIQISQELNSKTKIRFMGRNEGINDTLEVLKPYFEPKDHPDSKGLWLKIDKVGERILYSLWDVYFDHHFPYGYMLPNFIDAEAKDLSNSKSKWILILAIVPD